MDNSWYEVQASIPISLGLLQHVKCLLNLAASPAQHSEINLGLWIQRNQQKRGLQIKQKQL